MNDVLVQTSTNGVLAIAVILLGAMVVLTLAAMVFMYRHHYYVTQQQNQKIIALQNDLAALCSSSVGFGQRLEKTEFKLKQIVRRQYLYEVQQMQNKNYQRAKDMINQGDNIEKVVRECQITKTEAELILLANRMNRVA